MSGARRSDSPGAAPSPGDPPKRPAPAFHDLPPLQRWLLIASLTFTAGLVSARFASEVDSAEMLNRLFARAYMPTLTWNYDHEKHGPPVTIVSIDDSDLQNLHLSWPLPLDYYGRLIGKLVVYSPSAIFLDILFLDDRPEKQVQRLVEASCKAAENERPTQVFVASLGTATPSKTFNTLVESRTKDQRPCIIAVRANLLGDRFERSTWNYPLKQDSQYSAALALACHGNRRFEPCASVEPSLVMAINWPAGGSRINEDLSMRPIKDDSKQASKSQDGPESESERYAPTCRASTVWTDTLPPVAGLVKLLFANRAGQSVSSWFGFQDWFNRSQQSFCPHTTVIPVRALDGQGLNSGELGDALSNGLLLVGTDFQSSGDTIYSPLHDLLPGLHAHAMALDNLITYEGRYRRGGQFEFSKPTTPASAFTLVAVMLISLATSAWHVWLRPGHVRRVKGSAAGDWLFNRWLIIGPASRNPFVTTLKRIVLRPLACLRIAVLHVITFGSFPSQPSTSQHKPAWQTYLVGTLGLLTLSYVILFVGDRLFRVGPLNLVEYILFPFIIEFLNHGERLARIVFAAWHAAGSPSAAQKFRDTYHAPH